MAMGNGIKIALALAPAVLLATIILPIALAGALITGGGSTVCDPDTADARSGGGKSYLIGDSIGVGLQAELNNFTFQVTGGINLHDSLPKLEGDKAKIQAADNIVIELGTNISTNFAEDAKTMVNRIRSYNPDATIFWVEIFSKGSPGYEADAKIIYAEENKVIAGLSDVTMIKTANANIPLADGLHPTMPDGYKKLAKLIETAVKSGGGNGNQASSSNECDDKSSGPAPASGNCKANGLAFGLPSSVQADREAVFGEANSSAAKKPTTFFGIDIQAHEKVIPCLKAVEAEIKAKGFDDYKVRSAGAYNERPGEPLYYFHMYGAAIDINPDTNPYCACETHDMPDEWAEIFEKHGFFWGGNFRTTKDWMHFEWHGGKP